MTSNIEVKAEENFPITAWGYTKGKLLDDHRVWYIGRYRHKQASLNHTSWGVKVYTQCPHLLPQPQESKLEKKQYIGVLFVIPVIMTIQKHRFEIFTLVSEIHENVDLVIAIKNLFELEGVIDSWDSCVSFLNRSIPFFPREKVSVKPKKQKLDKYLTATTCFFGIFSIKF